MRGTDYVLKRIAFAIVTVFVAVSINFVLFRLAPGTAVSNLSRVPHATQQLRHALEKQLAGSARVVESDASVGGGAFPNTRIPSVALAFARDAQVLEQRLRLGEPAIIGRIADGRLLLDLRTILPGEHEMLAAALRVALAS